MKMKALKPLGEEKPTVINDPDTKIKTRDTKIQFTISPSNGAGGWCDRPGEG